MGSLKWIFDPAPPSGARAGGLASVHAFDPELDTFVREVLQNSRDQRVDTEIVDVTFTLNTLHGDGKRAFLDAISWETLGSHIDDAARDGGITIGPQLTQAMQVAASESLLVLRIDDCGTQGLTGAEDDPIGNFNALCRNMLITSESRKESGGSFGIGKSVLWRFSRFSTVLFSSHLHEWHEGTLRFFGRAELPFHRTEGEDWEGPGWFGVPSEASRYATRAESVWEDSALEIAQRLGLDRDAEQGSGTSILVVGFFEPGEELDRPVQEIAEDLLESASRWFWPSMLVERQHSLNVSVVIAENGIETSREFATITPEVSPFVTIASTDSPSLAALDKAGNVAEELLEFKIPSHHDPESGERARETNASIPLRVRSARPDESANLNRIALVRGSGMVVNYRRGRTPFGDQSYHAVLFAGTAHDTSEDSRKLEAFLRASEPPSHNDWVATTDRIRTEYPRGARARLDNLWKSIDATVARLLDNRPQDPTVGAPALARLLPLPGRGGGKTTTERFTTSGLRAELTDGIWSIYGQVRFRRANKRPWKFRIAPLLDGESGSGTELTVTDFIVDGCEIKSESGSLVCYVPSGITAVDFHAEACLSESELPEGDLNRTRMRLRIRPEVVMN